MSALDDALRLAEQRRAADAIDALVRGGYRVDLHDEAPTGDVTVRPPWWQWLRGERRANGRGGSMAENLAAAIAQIRRGA